MGSALRAHGVKYLAAASVLVFVWFVWRLGLHNDVRDKLASHLPSMGAPKHSPPAGDPKHTFPPKQPGEVNPMVILDEDEASEWCGRHRLDALPREEAKQRKLYDLLLVNTEMDMLDLRMDIMAEGIDYFVIIEADVTFQNNEKPLMVLEHWDQFKRHHSKMIRQTMNMSYVHGDATWDKEEASRNAGLTQVVPFLEGEQKANTDDVLLVADIDEIFKPETLKLFRNCKIPKDNTVHSRMYYYSFQWLCEANWNHPQATLYRGDDTTMPHKLRAPQIPEDHYVVREGGWHCSYCFSKIQEFVNKITSFSHAELNVPEFKDPKKILHRVRNGIDLYERSKCDRIDTNRDVPEFLTSNPDKYPWMINRDMPNGNLVDYVAR